MPRRRMSAAKRAAARAVTAARALAPEYGWNGCHCRRDRPIDGGGCKGWSDPVMMRAIALPKSYARSTPPFCRLIDGSGQHRRADQRLGRRFIAGRFAIQRKPVAQIRAPPLASKTVWIIAEDAIEIGNHGRPVFVHYHAMTAMKEVTQGSMTPASDQPGVGVPSPQLLPPNPGAQRGWPLCRSAPRETCGYRHGRRGPCPC